jgi:hypothetical protein
MSPNHKRLRRDLYIPQAAIYLNSNSSRPPWISFDASPHYSLLFENAFLEEPNFLDRNTFPSVSTSLDVENGVEIPLRNELDKQERIAHLSRKIGDLEMEILDRRREIGNYENEIQSLRDIGEPYSSTSMLSLPGSKEPVDEQDSSANAAKLSMDESSRTRKRRIPGEYRCKDCSSYFDTQRDLK